MEKIACLVEEIMVVVRKKDECGCNRGSSGSGILGNCSSFLFLLVILFLCNSNNNHNLGFCGGSNLCNNNFGCGTGC